MLLILRPEQSGEVSAVAAGLGTAGASDSVQGDANPIFFQDYKSGSAGLQTGMSIFRSFFRLLPRSYPEHRRHDLIPCRPAGHPSSLVGGIHCPVLASRIRTGGGRGPAFRHRNRVGQHPQLQSRARCGTRHRRYGPAVRVENKYMAIAALAGFLLALVLTDGSLGAAFGALAAIAGIGWIVHRWR